MISTHRSFRSRHRNAVGTRGGVGYTEYLNNTGDAAGIPTETYCNKYDAEIKACKLATEVTKYQPWFTTGDIPDCHKISTTGTSVQENASTADTAV